MTKPDEIASFSQFSVVSHMFYMPKTLWLDLWAERERERFIPSHNIVKICSQNHCALQFVRLEEQHGHN